MKILNLTDLNKSDIKYKISKFPDGQQNIVINPTDLAGYFDTDGETKFWKSKKITKVQIKSRLNNWLDLELIICAVASLRELGVKEIHLYTPYIVGARSDRKFEEGGNNYLKDVICPVINSLNFESVTCIDPHSDVLEACIKGFKKESNLKLVQFAGNEISLGKLPRAAGEIALVNWSRFVLVSPDAGATHKIYKLAEQIGYKGDIITCSKERDKDGKLTQCKVPYSLNYYHNDKIIIDDICDGGATFINIAKELKSGSYKDSPGKIYLIITHGIFSKGLKELSEYFDGIYCTNSYSTIFDGNDAGKLVKQLNVF